MQSIRNHTILFLFLITVSVAFYFDGCSTKPVVIRTITETTGKFVEENYQRQAQKYKLLTDSLNNQLQQTDSLLQLEKRKVTSLRKEIQKTVVTYREAKTTEEKISHCDTLIEQVVQLSEQQEIKDSITESKIVLIAELIIEKDEMLINCEFSYRAIQQAYEQSQKDNIQLSGQFFKHLKKERRNQTKNKIIIVGAFIASTAAAIVLTK